MRDVKPGDLEPYVELKQLSADARREKACWMIRWAVRNRSAHPLYISNVRLPHGQFKSEEKSFDPAIDLKQEQEAEFQIFVKCDEPPGPVTENAFVIFYATWLEEPWRIFVRVRIVMNADGRPQATAESVTTQRVGLLQEDSS
jgi:hypothetical protein